MNSQLRVLNDSLQENQDCADPGRADLAVTASNTSSAPLAFLRDVNHGEISLQAGGFWGGEAGRLLDTGPLCHLPPRWLWQLLKLSKSLSPFVRWDETNTYLMGLGIKWIMQVKHFSHSKHWTNIIYHHNYFDQVQIKKKKKKKVNKAKTRCQEAYKHFTIVCSLAASVKMCWVSKCFYQHDIWKAEDRTTSWGFGKHHPQWSQGSRSLYIRCGKHAAIRAVMYPNMLGIMLHRLTRSGLPHLPQFQARL